MNPKINVKNTWRIVYILLTVVIVLILIIKCREMPSEIMTKEDGMPDFEFNLIGGDVIEQSDVDVGKFTLLWFFNTECDLCTAETEALIDSVTLLNDCQIIMVSLEDSAKVAGFNNRFRLTDLPQVSVAYVPGENKINTINSFKIYTNPTLYVYNMNRSLIKYKPGPVTILEIMQYLKK